MRERQTQKEKRTFSCCKGQRNSQRQKLRTSAVKKTEAESKIRKCDPAIKGERSRVTQKRSSEQSCFQ